MRKLIVKMSFSVDGFVADLHGKNDWIFRSSDPDSLAWSVAQTSEAGLIVMGRKSFEHMAPYWPTAPGAFARPMNEIPKGVFSKKGFAGINLAGADQSPAVASWNGARVFSGDLAEEIKALKAESGKPVVAIGGAGFMRSLISSGLVDEFHMATHPVILGSGLPVFTELEKPLDLKLVDSMAFPKGITVRIYHPA